MPENKLYIPDNIDILRDHSRLPTGSVDLVYLDPPFNSKRAFNAFFKERSGGRSEAMIRAFNDTRRWDRAAAAFDGIIKDGPPRVAQAMRAFYKLMPKSDMLAYLSMMAPRLVELHRVLEPTGSLYLRCGPTASHCLKILPDAIFGPDASSTRSSGNGLAPTVTPSKK
jgi:site-specific DNA-methyltransferase (adenine-specific)